MMSLSKPIKEQPRMISTITARDIRWGILTARRDAISFLTTGSTSMEVRVQGHAKGKAYQRAAAKAFANLPTMHPTTVSSGNVTGNEYQFVYRVHERFV